LRSRRRLAPHLWQTSLLSEFVAPQDLHCQVSIHSMIFI